MKLIRSILALIVFVGFSFSMTAQNVTINKSQVTLETVLDDLSRQTGFEFLHSRPTVNPDEIVSLNVSGVSLETALQKLFSNKPIGYEIKDSKVYLIAKDTPDTPKRKGCCNRYNRRCHRSSCYRSRCYCKGYNKRCQYRT